MGENTKCTIMVDASSAVGRVSFSGTNSLGVLYPGYVMGQPITVDKGSSKYITVYNGMSKGSVTFNVVFSSAQSLLASGIALAASVAAML